MSVLVDTSAWIEHLRKPIPALIDALSERRVIVHPTVIGELSCGTFRRRHEFLGNIKVLPRAQEASFEECLELIEDRRLYGKGLGFADIQLLAAALLSDASILSFDRAMKAAAHALGIDTK